MLELGAESKYNPRNALKPRGGGGEVYTRLIRYAWGYKFRLVMALLFSVILASSLGSILVVVGNVVNIVTWEKAPPTDVAAADAAMPQTDRWPAKAGKVRPDPALKIVEGIREGTEWAKDTLGWAPTGLDERFLGLVDRMRKEPMRAMYVLVVTVILLAGVSSSARFLQEYFAASIGASVSVKLGREMYENVMRLSLRFFEERPSGEILARFTNDIFMVNRGLAGVFVKLMSEPAKAVVFLIIALRVDIHLTLLGLCVLPPVILVLYTIGKKVKRSVRRSLEKVASMAGVVKESVTGITIVKGFCMEEYEIGRMGVEIRKLRRYLLQMVKADAAVGPLTEFILITGVVLFAAVSVHKVLTHELSQGDLLRLFGALAMMLDPVRKLAAVNNAIQTSIASAERVFEFIDLKPDIVEADNAVELPVIRHTLSFNDVHFSYDGKTEVLRGIDLQINKGEMVALVGFSGAGKSTVAKLIPRFYDVTSGSICVDGVDIRTASFRSLRGQLSIVTQDTVLFNESVRANIAFGHGEYSEERVLQAARAAHAEEFIGKLDHGFDTVIGESGVSLSGGQRQRLAIARALIKDPAILILDEATSSLDSESEQAIQKALDEFVVGRTTVVIAHRLSTIQRADRIVVLDDGRIAEQGTHDELLQRSGIYRRLYEIQFADRDKQAES